MALAEIFEQGFQQGQITSSEESANKETRSRLLASVSQLTLSPGYQRVAYHLMDLEAQRDAGLPMVGLAAWEGAGLLTLRQARTAHDVRHPTCTSCGTRQSSKLLPTCMGCGAEFRGRK